MGNPYYALLLKFAVYMVSLRLVSGYFLFHVLYVYYDTEFNLSMFIQAFDSSFQKRGDLKSGCFITGHHDDKNVFHTTEKRYNIIRT